MKPASNGWTGGQYSVFRLLLASYLVPSFLAWLPEDPLRGGIGVVASLLLGMGLFDRTAAVTLALGLLPESALELRYAWWLLVVHVFLPGRPYGAWSRRLNPDPAGGWHMPDGMLRGVQALLVLAWIGELAGWRPDSVPLGGMLLLHVLAFDPAWIRGAAQRKVDLVFYDGSCAVCHATVRFLIAEDRSGERFRFATLKSEQFERAVSGASENLPDSVVVRTAGGEILARSAAFLHIGARLGGFWRLLAMAVRALPLALRDAAYDRFARVRYRVFGRREEACPPLTPELRKRLEP